MPNGGGGIIGDDMGLGKTVQICSFLSGLFYTYSMRKPVQTARCLIVAPVSVIENWRKEYTKWVTNMMDKSEMLAPLVVFHNLSKNARERVLREFANSGGCLLTSYGTITAQVDLFTSKTLQDNGRAIHFDYVILDEGTLNW